MLSPTPCWCEVGALHNDVFHQIISGDNTGTVSVVSLLSPWSWHDHASKPRVLSWSPLRGFQFLVAVSAGWFEVRPPVLGCTTYLFLQPPQCLLVRFVLACPLSLQKVWDIKTGKLEFEFRRAHQDRPAKRGLPTNCGQEKEIGPWLATQSKMNSLQDHKMTCMAFDEPKRCLYTGGEAGSLSHVHLGASSSLPSLSRDFHN